ncbi:EAL domain-containing protein [Deinococcus navajonensis]|uniref:EAL domain-containing protein n=1 Tax=Deinococcus navajonensis TaxID=309884 RepID=A0ABV8XPC7_9DEIO
MTPPVQTADFAQAMLDASDQAQALVGADGGVLKSNKRWARQFPEGVPALVLDRLASVWSGETGGLTRSASVLGASWSARRLGEASLGALITVEETSPAPLQRMMGVLEAFPGAFVVYDLDWHCRYANATAQQAFVALGLPADLGGRTLWEMFPGCLGGPLEHHFRQAMALQTVQTFEMPFPELQVWVEVQVFPSPQGISVFFRNITERLQLHEQLQDSELRYRRLIETMREGMALVSADFRIEFINPQMTSMLGFQTPAELTGRSALEFIPQTHWIEAKRHMQRRAKGMFEPLQLPLTRQDGTRLWVDISASSLFEGERFVGIVVLLTDVTEQRRVQDELHERSTFAQTLLDSSPDCVKVLDLEGRLLSINDRGLGLLGAGTREQLLGRPWVSLMVPEQARIAEEALNRARSGQVARCELQVDTLCGTAKCWDVAVSSIQDAGGQITRLLAISRDMTELQLARLREQAQAQQHTQMLESITDAFYASDADWNFTYVNAQAARLLGRPAHELIGRNGWEMFPEALATEVERNYRLVMEERRSINFEVFYMALGRWFELHAYPSGDGIAVCFRDISERKNAQQLEQARNHVLERTVKGEALQSILEDIARLVEKQFPNVLCYVMLKRGNSLYATAAPSLPDSYFYAMDGLEIGPHVGSCGAAAYTRQMVMIEDIATHPDWSECRDLALMQGLQACLSAPILSGAGEVLGTLGVYRRKTGAFPQGVVDLVDRTRHLAAVAIEHHRLEEQLAFQAQHDPLTGLPNRALFTHRLERAIEEAEAGASSVALAFIDLDDFKTINDAQGHLVGDQVLREISRRLQSCARSGDTLARIGGDEFTLILPRTSEAAAGELARAMLAAVTEPVVVGERELFINASIGVSVFPHGGRDAINLQRHADMAMFTAKTRKAGVAFYEPEMNRRAAERLQLANHLRRAIELDELELHYQPQVNLGDGTLSGMEALLRWRHPLLGMVSPLRFIPVAEETGLIVPIGEWVLREACRQGVRWQQEGHSAFRLAVNVSALQFEREDFIETVAAVLAETGFSADALELELTESVVMRNVEESARRMTQLRELGVSIAVDDFGTGYSSLSYLPRLPLNVLKIDRSFVSNLGHDVASLPVVRAITSLAQNLGLLTIAEGIETEEEWNVLRDLGCEVGQGYLFSRPMPADQVLPAGTDIATRRVRTV